MLVSNFFQFDENKNKWFLGIKFFSESLYVLSCNFLLEFIKQIFIIFLISSKTETTRIEFSPEPVTQSRSPFHPIPTYSPSSISGAASMGSTFSSIGSISSNIGAASGTPTSSIQLTPTLTDEQVIRLTRAAERYCICNKSTSYHLLKNILLIEKNSFYQTCESISIARHKATKYEKAINERD